jgi:hypothetical protein
VDRVEQHVGRRQQLEKIGRRLPREKLNPLGNVRNHSRKSAGEDVRPMRLLSVQ